LKANPIPGYDLEDDFDRGESEGDISLSDVDADMNEEPVQEQE
jgi:hypothetical protein